MSRKLHNTLITQVAPQQFSIEKTEDGTLTQCPLFGFAIKNAQLYGAVITNQSERWKEVFVFRSESDRWVVLKIENSLKVGEVTRWDHLVGDDVKAVAEFIGQNVADGMLYNAFLAKSKPTLII